MKQKAADSTSRGLFVSDFAESSLVLVIISASGEDSAIRHCDLSLSDSVGLWFLGANAADLNFVADLQRVRSPALTLIRIIDSQSYRSDPLTQSALGV